MASAIDLCNRVLLDIGARGNSVATIASFTEASAAARACQLNYDAMRKLLIRCAPWGCTRKQLPLDLLGDAASGTCPFPWLYEYAYPSDCLKFRYLLQIPQNWPFPSSPTVAPAVGDTLVTPYVSTTRRQRFLISSDLDPAGNARKVLLTNTNQALGVYSYDCTNVDQFDASFTEALVAMVAAKLVMPLTGNTGLMPTFMQIAKDRVVEARVADGNENLPTTDHTPDWIIARGFQADFYYSGYLQYGPGVLSESWDSLSWGA